MIHLQWTGSDNNRNNVAGEGTEQTDRPNMIQIEDGKKNCPISKTQQTLFSTEEAILLAWNGLTKKGESHCKSIQDLLQLNENDREEDAKNCGKLNPSNPYFDGGFQPCPDAGVYYYYSSRENNFSNRGQKGMIIAEPCDGSDSCSNADTRPENDLGERNHWGEGATASTSRVSLAAIATIVLGAAMM